MIKTTIDGSTVTASAWEDDVREVNCKAYYYQSNQWYAIPNEIKEWNVTKGICGDDKFELGTVFIPTGSVTFSTSEEESALSSDIKILRIDAGVLVGSAYEYITVGTFYVTEKSVDAYTTSFTLTSYLLGGRSGRANASGLNKVYPSSVIDGLKTDMGGITITSDVAFASTAMREAFTGGTCREALESLSKLMGMCVTEFSDGIKFRKPFPSEYDSITIDESKLGEPFVGKGNFALDTGKIMVSEGYSTGEESNDSDETTDDNVEEVSYTYQKSSSQSGGTITKNVTLESYDVITECKYMSDTLFDNFCTVIAGEYTAWESGTIELQLGDPRIDALDVIQLMNGTTQTHSIYAWNITHSYDGGFKTTVTAPSIDRSDSAIGYDVSSSGIAVIVPIIENKVGNLVTEVNNLKIDVNEATQDVELLWDADTAAKQRTENLETAMQFKMSTNLVVGDATVGEMNWDEDLNALRITCKNDNATSYEVRIAGNGIGFFYNNTEVASINQDKLIINKTMSYTDSVIGSWSWEAHPSTKNLQLKWRG